MSDHTDVDGVLNTHTAQQQKKYAQTLFQVLSDNFDGDAKLVRWASDGTAIFSFNGDHSHFRVRRHLVRGLGEMDLVYVTPMEDQVIQDGSWSFDPYSDRVTVGDVNADPIVVSFNAAAILAIAQ